MIKANDPHLKSWIEVPKESDFPIQNLPFGIFKTNNLSPRTGVAISNKVLDLAALAELGYFDTLNMPNDVFNKEYLNDFIKLGKTATRDVRNRVSEILNAENAELRDNADHKSKVLHEV